jgi:hypothetical protein
MARGVGMIRKAGLSLGLALITVTSLTSVADAQWYGYRHGFFPPLPPQTFPVEPDEMSPRELTHAARAQGFRRPSRPIYHDDFAVLNAIHPNGQPVRVTLDIYSGRIINLVPLAQRPVARSRPVIRETLQEREVEPRRPKTRTVERSPDMRPPVSREKPSAERNQGATPEKPTIVRRTPMLPPAETKAPNKDTSTAAGAGSNVETGTRAAPRRIEITPSDKSDVPTPPI